MSTNSTNNLLNENEGVLVLGGVSHEIIDVKLEYNKVRFNNSLIIIYSHSFLYLSIIN